MTTATETLEVWKNRGRGLFVMSKRSIDGTKRPEPIPGGREFQVTPEERRNHQASCASDKQDPFRNGLLVPVNSLAVAALEEISVTRVENPWSVTSRVAEAEPEAEPLGVMPRGPESSADRIDRLRRELMEAEAEAGDPDFQIFDEEVAATAATPPPPAAEPQPAPPNVLTEAEMQDVLTGHGNRAKSLLARIDSPAMLELLYSQALSSSTPPRIELIERRWLEVDPFARPVRPGGGVGGGSVDDGGLVGPQGMDDDETPGPKGVQLDGDPGPDMTVPPLPGADDDDPDGLESGATPTSRSSD